MFTYNRPGIELNGKWKFCPDPMQRCRRQQWWKNIPAENTLFPSWEPEGLWDIDVPGTWKTQFPELKWYDGHAVYMKEFDLPEIPAGQEAFLCFDGIIYSAEIYLNGQFVGKHEWGYSPFQFRVSGMLAKRNRLFVLVENQLRADRVPGEVYDWNNDGGIINPVKLIHVPQAHIENFRTQTKLEGDEAVIEVEVALASRNARAKEEVKISIPELGLEGKVLAQAGELAKTSFRIPRKQIKLWSPESPTLYRTELSTRFESIADEIGFREIRTESINIMLNGEPVRLYGVCVHAEYKGTGRSATPEGIKLLIDSAKELGVNFLRCAHYPYSEAFTRAMDKAGLMWWEETPAYWLINMGDPGQTRRACGILEEAIRRDWNRASLIIWSISNECCHRNPNNPDDNNYPYWFTVAPMVRQLDPSRLISCAEAGNWVATRPIWNPGQADEFHRKVEDAPFWRLVHSDEWHALLDVYAANLYLEPGEAEVVYKRYAELLGQYGKPMILSEFGSCSLRGAKVAPDKLGSEERHAAIMRECYEAFAQVPEITGYCPWSLTDVRVPIHWRWFNQGKGVFRYGIMDEAYLKKEKVFGALKESIAKLKQHWKGRG